MECKGWVVRQYDARSHGGGRRQSRPAPCDGHTREVQLVLQENVFADSAGVVDVSVVFHSRLTLLSARSDFSTYRYAKITWASCARFYDPLFPKACQAKDTSATGSALGIGVTVSAAWDIRDLSTTSMITKDDATNAITSFLENGKLSSTYLPLRRGDSMGKYRKIGYRALDATSVTDVDCSIDECGSDAYHFKIDHLSPDGNVFFCRFSFTASLSSQSTVHLLQFMGCCRLDRYSYQNLALSSAQSSFEISATVVTNGLSPIDTISPQISAPYLVNLTSTANLCTPPSFDLQAFHPLDSFQLDYINYFPSTKLDLNAGKFVFSSCESNTGDYWWVAKVEVQNTLTCGKATGTENMCASAVIDFLIHLKVLPTSTVYSLPIVANPDSFLSPLTSRDQFFSIQCNTETFEFSNAKTNNLRIGFQTPGVSLSNNSLQWIFQNNDFPSITISSVKFASEYGFVELTWRPHCEDPSQLGLFLLCFTARLFDYNSVPGFSSCIYVKSLPPLPNPPPEIVYPIQQTCSSDCVSCCGEFNCTLQNNATCCKRAHAIRGASFQMDVKAITQNYVQRVDVNFSYPEIALPVKADITKKWGCGSTPFDQCTSSPATSNDVEYQWHRFEG
eukprot:763429-Hanusia_phi.AAC.7